MTADLIVLSPAAVTTRHLHKRAIETDLTAFANESGLDRLWLLVVALRTCHDDPYVEFDLLVGWTITVVILQHRAQRDLKFAAFLSNPHGTERSEIGDRAYHEAITQAASWVHRQREGGYMKRILNLWLYAFGWRQEMPKSLHHYRKRIERYVCLRCDTASRPTPA